MIVRAAFTAVFFGLAATVVLAANDQPPQAKPAGANPVFEQFKLLAGEWVGKEQGKDGQEVNVQYKVTSGGSAVVETIFAGAAHEMVTVIHPDGADLLLTHYCMLGNQPQMKAAVGGDSKKVAFKFVRATNMKSEKEMHMHDATYTFVDRDTLKTEWTHYMDGKAGGVVVIELKRKK
jgi:hypothetical protein